jgi:hypothetical protein
MNKEKVRSRYKCNEDELYAVCEIAIGNLEKDLAAFAAKSTNYTGGLIAALRLKLSDARGLPNEEQRNGKHEVLRGELPKLVQEVKRDFKSLQSYIRDGWPGEVAKPRYEAAGLNEYRSIASSNWEAVVTLNNSMKRFLADAAAATKLTNPGGMIAGFDVQVQTNFDAFDDVYQKFMSSRETTSARNAKVAANNKIYNECMRFMKFGRESVFRHDRGFKKRYTWDVLKQLVTPDRGASLAVKVKRTDGSLMTNVEVQLKKEGEPLMKLKTDDKGVAKFEVAGKCRLMIGDVVAEKNVRKGRRARMVVVIGV